MGYIRGFDGVRAISVIIVILGHLGITAQLGKIPEWGVYLQNLVAPTRGVEIFFVLSGFLITGLLIAEHDNTGSISLRRFAARRALRILPVYFLFCALVIFLDAVGNAGLKIGAVPYLLTMIFNFTPNYFRTTVVGHVWSLAVEQHFYIFWPLIFIFFYKRGFSLIYIAVLFVLASVVYRYMAPRNGAYNYFAWTLPAASPIAIGCIIAIVLRLRSGWFIEIFRSWYSVVVGTFFYIISATYPIPFGSVELRAVGIGLLLAWIFLNQQKLVVSALEISPLRYIGKISYGLYLWHVFFIGTGSYRFEGQTWPPDQLTGLVLLAAFAPLSWHGFEQPILKLKSKYRSNKRPVSHDAKEDTEHGDELLEIAGRSAKEKPLISIPK